MVNEKVKLKRNGVKDDRLSLSDVRIELMKWVKIVWDEMKHRESLLERCWENMPLSESKPRELDEVIEDARAQQDEEGEYELKEFDDAEEDEISEDQTDAKVYRSDRDCRTVEHDQCRYRYDHSKAVPQNH